MKTKWPTLSRKIALAMFSSPSSLFLVRASRTQLPPARFFEDENTPGERKGKGESRGRKGSFILEFSIARRERNVIWWCWHSSETKELFTMVAKGSCVRGEGSTKNRVLVPINHQTATLIMLFWWSRRLITEEEQRELYKSSLYNNNINQHYSVAQ